MQSTQRQRVITLAFILTLSLFAADRLALSPFLDLLHDMHAQRDLAEKDLADARRTLALEKELRPLLQEMSASISTDASTTESKLLHRLHDWQQRAGVSNASFQRTRSSDGHGFTCLTFNVSATGNMLAVASLIYELETSTTPLHVEDVRVAPKRDGADELQLRLNVSTLCRAANSNWPAHTSLTSADPAGERP